MIFNGKIRLDVPGIKFIYFTPDQKISDIFDFLNLQEIDTLDIPFIDTSLILDDIEESQEISESVIETGKNSISLEYMIPKKIAFTQRFQDKIKYDVPNIIESVYDDCKVTDISYKDEDKEMKLVINIKFSNENFMKYSKYLDENVGFIIKDIVEYYSK